MFEAIESRPPVASRSRRGFGGLSLACLTTLLLASPGVATAHAEVEFDIGDPGAIETLLDDVDAPLLLAEDAPIMEPTADRRDEAVHVEGAAGDVAIAFPASNEVAETLTDGSQTFAAPDDDFASVLRYQDGAAQVATIIAAESAPDQYRYDLSGDAASLELLGDGSVLVRASDGSAIGAVEAPWAVDATGIAVPTSYAVDGLTLTQHVDHTSNQYEYPLVADPTYSGKVLSRAVMSDYGTFGPGRKLSAYVSAYGRMVAADDPGRFSSQGWGLLVGSFGGYMPAGAIRNSMKQQWDCHVLGHCAEQGSFDLETWRPSKPNWHTRLVGTWPPSAICNW